MASFSSLKEENLKIKLTVPELLHHLVLSYQVTPNEIPNKSFVIPTSTTRRELLKLFFSFSNYEDDVPVFNHPMNINKYGMNGCGGIKTDLGDRSKYVHLSLTATDDTIKPWVPLVKDIQNPPDVPKDLPCDPSSGTLPMDTGIKDAIADARAINLTKASDKQSTSGEIYSDEDLPAFADESDDDIPSLASASPEASWHLPDNHFDKFNQVCSEDMLKQFNKALTERMSYLTEKVDALKKYKVDTSKIYAVDAPMMDEVKSSWQNKPLSKEEQEKQISELRSELDAKKPKISIGQQEKPTNVHVSNPKELDAQHAKELQGKLEPLKINTRKDYKVVKDQNDDWPSLLGLDCEEHFSKMVKDLTEKTANRKFKAPSTAKYNVGTQTIPTTSMPQSKGIQFTPIVTLHEKRPINSAVTGPAHQSEVDAGKNKLNDAKPAKAQPPLKYPLTVGLKAGNLDRLRLKFKEHYTAAAQPKTDIYYPSPKPRFGYLHGVPTSYAPPSEAAAGHPFTFTPLEPIHPLRMHPTFCSRPAVPKKEESSASGSDVSFTPASGNGANERGEDFFFVEVADHGEEEESDNKICVPKHGF